MCYVDTLGGTAQISLQSTPKIRNVLQLEV